MKPRGPNPILLQLWELLVPEVEAEGKNLAQVRLDQRGERISSSQ